MSEKLKWSYIPMDQDIIDRTQGQQIFSIEAP